MSISKKKTLFECFFLEAKFFMRKKNTNVFFELHHYTRVWWCLYLLNEPHWQFGSVPGTLPTMTSARSSTNALPRAPTDAVTEAQYISLLDGTSKHMTSTNVVISWVNEVIFIDIRMLEQLYSWFHVSHVKRRGPYFTPSTYQGLVPCQRISDILIYIYIYRYIKIYIYIYGYLYL